MILTVEFKVSSFKCGCASLTRVTLVKWFKIYKSIHKKINGSNGHDVNRHGRIGCLLTNVRFNGPRD